MIDLHTHILSVLEKGSKYPA